MSIWDGSFTPLRKHRDGCGKIENHIRVVSKTLLDDDEMAVLNEEVENDEDALPEDMVVLGEGDLAYSVMMGWVGDSTGEYEYVIRADEEPSDEDAVGMIADYIEEENARRRKAKEEEIAHE